jgi:hypothetical protein
MNRLTADEILQKTFEHLDQVLDEKNREDKKKSDEQQNKSASAEIRKEGERKVTE